jgi:integrase/recombinase XerD
LHQVFDHADDQVVIIAGSGRKGWLPAYRDAVMFKVAYSYGLRFNELRHLQTVGFARNPHAREFGRYGLVHVRYGKAKEGSPPKRRSVLTVFDWTSEVIADWLKHGQPFMDDGIDLFPSERGALLSEDAVLTRLRRYCNDLGLSDGLDLHSFRRSDATHLVEAGWDPLFVQQQMGHEHASTTSLYTCVSSDFRVRTLRLVLDETVAEALTFGEEETS